MKRVGCYLLNDEIPDNAKFLHASVVELIKNNEDVMGFFYEIPIKPEITKTPKSIEAQQDADGLIDDVIKFLNIRTGKKFSNKSKETRNKIRARINEVFLFENFTQVIIKKCDEWLEDPKWNQYLRPSTLFGSKFESYLNQKTGTDMKEDLQGELDEVFK